MRAKALVVLNAVMLGVGLLVLTPSVNPTVSGSPSDDYAFTSSSAQPTQPDDLLSSSSPYKTAAPSQKAPLAVWECTSSWYGEDFDGQPTATGEIYDMYATTAAHPTLPLGSIVRVVNTRNRRSQVVRINDRGPYVLGRELDVSYEVARRLGFDQRGTTRVRLELLEVPARPNSVRHD